MRPTPLDALDGAERLLRPLVAGGELAEDAGDEVLALLSRARRGWSTRLPFLDEDTRALQALLTSLRAALPVPLAAEIDVRLAHRSTAPVLDVEEADRRNAELRELLAHAVRELPASESVPRERLRAYLAERVERAPT